MKEWKELQRYQFQPWYVKVWRRRFQLQTPVLALRNIFYSKDLSWRGIKFAWSIARGEADIGMEWWYTWEECTELRSKRKGL